MGLDSKPLDRPMKSSYPWDSEATLPQYVAKAAQTFGQRPAFSQERRSLSFAQLERMSTEFAISLSSNPELTAGSRIAVQLPNILAYPVVVWGIMKAGMVVVNVNPQYTAYETRKILKDAEVSGWICSEISAHLVDVLAPELKIPFVLTCELFALHSWLERMFYRTIIRTRMKLKKPVPKYPCVGLRQALRKGRGKSFQAPKIHAEDLALLQYTGGSTGGLKGAMLTHRNIVANMEQVSRFLAPHYRAGEELIIAPLPIYHIFAFTVHCATPLIMGAHSVLILDPTQLGRMIKTLRRHRFTAISGVNTLFHSLIRQKSFASLNFSSLRFGIAGGMKLDPKVGQQFETLTGRPILEGFGMSELSPVASINPPDANRLGTVGVAMPFTEITCIDRAGREILEPEVEGEMLVRGPQVMQGYWRQPEESAWHLLPGGWMRTGDLAKRDKDGYWSITGRCKRMILVSGFNVYPQEIEDVLSLHPDVSAARAIGVPHAISGEVVKVLVVRRNSELKAQDIKDHCRLHLTAYKVPKHVEFCAQLPAEEPGVTG